MSFSLQCSDLTEVKPVSGVSHLRLSQHQTTEAKTPQEEQLSLISSSSFMTPQQKVVQSLNQKNDGSV